MSTFFPDFEVVVAQSVAKVDVKFSGVGRGATEASLSPVRSELRNGILQEVTALKNSIVADLIQGAKSQGNTVQVQRH